MSELENEQFSQYNIEMMGDDGSWKVLQSLSHMKSKCAIESENFRFYRVHWKTRQYFENFPYKIESELWYTVKYIKNLRCDCWNKIDTLIFRFRRKKYFKKLELKKLKNIKRKYTLSRKAPLVQVIRHK